MGKKIETNKAADKSRLSKDLIKLHPKKAPDLDKFFGKINFGTDGLDYQLKVRDRDPVKI